MNMRMKPNKKKVTFQSQRELNWVRFKKHRVAVFSLGVIVVFLIFIIFAEFLIPYSPFKRFKDKLYIPPRHVRFIDEQGEFHLRPFIYNYHQELNLTTWERVYTEDKDEKYEIRFFVRGFEYKLLGLFPTNIHLFGGRENGPLLFLFGTDKFGRDLFSCTIYATRISLSIAFLGVAISLILGIILGGISGYYGGMIDNIIQRISEFFLTIPKIPLWMTLGAAIPLTWSVTKIYIAIVLIVSLMSWPWLARGIRSKLISLREEDYVYAAKSYGVSSRGIIFKYLLPNVLSYIIVVITLSVPSMILFETTLSFLGLGLRPPAISWGVLLHQAQNFQAVIMYLWLLIPGIFVITSILAFNFVGDALRDAADPYQKI